MKATRVYPRGGVYRLGKFEIIREPRVNEGGCATKIIWRVWEDDNPIDGFPTLRQAIESIRTWEDPNETEND